MYNTTPHSTTGKTPTELLSGKTIRSKIPSINDLQTAPPRIGDGEAQDRDVMMKFKGKISEDHRRHAKASNIQEGDQVLLQNLLPSHKLKTTFGPVEYTVVNRRGNCVKVIDPISGNTYERNIAHVKKLDNAEGESNTAGISEPQPTSTLQRPSRPMQKPVRYKDYVAQLSTDQSP
ncbi:hypothetical protein RP20_CCG019293 [Aedes albopictus]|nr:hypothetical protein RP20_CCG019293 [Aedes albopictus]